MNTFAQSVLDPRGPMAGRIHDLWLVLLAVSVVVWVAVMIVLLVIFLRRRRESPASLQELGRGVGIAVGITAITVFGILIASILTGGAIASVPANSLELSIVGHQWWWEIEYPGIPANRTVKTANEIHIPAGRPVRLKLSSRDVIHSFWIPNLRGKIDLVPSRINTTWIQADKPGVYRGQCAEFCGFQHAHMAVTLIADDDAGYKRWYERQLRQAAEPEQDSQIRGREIFMNSPCVVCHTIRGTEARGSVGPDLTHLGSRLTLAAGTLPNTRGNLAGWVVDAQSTKPGSRMPPMSIEPQDLEPLLDYLGSLR